MTAIRFGLLAAFGLGFAGQAAAQDIDCAATWQVASAAILGQAADVGVSPDNTPVYDGTGCSLRDVSLEMSGPLAISIGTISWSGDGWNRLATQGLPPFNARIVAKDIRFVPVIDDPVLSYLMQEQSAAAGVDLELITDWDSVTQQTAVMRLRMVFPGDNAIEYSAAVSGLDLTYAATLQRSAATATLDEYRLHIQTNGLFEQYLLMPLGAALLTGSTEPKADVADLKTQGQTLAAAAPDDLSSQDTKAAMSELIRDMPHPKGDIHLHMQAEPGLSIMRFVTLANNPEFDALDSVLGLLDGVRVDVTYTSAGAPD